MLVVAARSVRVVVAEEAVSIPLARDCVGVGVLVRGGGVARFYFYLLLKR